MTNKQAVIIGLFVGSAILTVGAGIFGNDDNSSNDNSPASYQNGQLTHQDSVLLMRGVDQSNELSLSPNHPVSRSEAMEGDPYEELNSLVGLDEVKEEVNSLANIVKIQKQREEKGLRNTAISYHCVFSGSPGTGKTTVARILARIYKDLGVLKSGHLVETDRSGLIAEYVGQTGPKTNALIDSALGGVLFIDEAYALLDNGGYGEEAIATLLKRMEDDRDNLVVIVAGYSNEMKRFIDSNPGLQSRFTRYIEFPDYSSEDLYKIFLVRAEKYKYVLNPEADAYLRQALDYVVAHKSRNFGNARYVRNLFESCTTFQANRLGSRQNLTEADLCQLTKSDIEQAYRAVRQ